jgi:hypothetical protein
MNKGLKKIINALWVQTDNAASSRLKAAQPGTAEPAWSSLGPAHGHSRL